MTFAVSLRRHTHIFGKLGALALILAAGPLGCADDPPPRPRGLLDAEGNAVETNAARPARAEPRQRAPAEEAPAAPPPPAALPSPFRDEEQAVETKGPQAERTVEQEERDLSAELAKLVGQPVQCLDLDKVAGSGGKIEIRVRAMVAPSGRITRASATAPGQAREATKCIESRVTAGSLRGPIQDAPRSVSSETEIEVVRAESQTVSTPPSDESVRSRSYANQAQPAEGVIYAQPAD